MFQMPERLAMRALFRSGTTGSPSLQASSDDEEDEEEDVRELP